MSKIRLAVSTRKGLLFFSGSDGSWKVDREEFLGAHMSYTEIDRRTDTIFACLDHGHFGCKLQRSTDHGETWDEIAAPQYPEGAVLGRDPFAEGQADELPPPSPAVLKYMWSLTNGAADQPGRIYIGTEPGGLFVSNDNGDSFQLVEPLWDHPSRKESWFGGGRDQPGIHSVLVDPRNSEHIYTGISCAGMFASEDGGQTWEPRNKGIESSFMPDANADVGHDPHLLVQCASEPDKLWQQNHCGVYRSIDCGRSWTNVSQNDGPVDFGFTVVVDPNDGEVAWVVPSTSDQERIAIDRKLVVCRTDDGGKTWNSFGKGLPSENCYDFSFRHGLALHEGVLALGTASGSLYVSRDRGESWDAIASHLPPVYSVRFV